MGGYSSQMDSRVEEVIEIEIHGAELVRIFQTWRTTQDLYVSLLWIRGQDVYDIGNTQIQRNCDKAAGWNETFRLGFCEGNLKLVVYAKNALFADVVCGGATISFDKLKAIIDPGQSLKEIAKLDNKGEVVGEMSFTLRRQEVDKRSDDTLAHRIFSMFAVIEGGKKCLQLEKIEDVMKALAIEIGEPLRNIIDIQNVEDWFWRYSDSETKVLNETQAMLMMRSMLMRIRNTARPDDIPKNGVAVKNVQDFYEKGEQLGKGGEGTVHFATQQKTGRKVVLKQYAKKGKHGKNEQETMNEFNLLCQLPKHPKISRYYELFQDSDNFYIASEPYFGGNLIGLHSKAYASHVEVSHAWVAKITEQIAYGLDFLHCRGIVHCDLKEPNIMVAGEEDLEEPHVVLIDFGLANSLSKSQYGGTPGYMPPEVWVKGLWTPRGDVFSLGCVVYTLIMGQHPFRISTSLDEIEEFTKHGSPPSVEKVPSHTRKLVEKMLLQEPLTERPPIKTVLASPWLTEISARRAANIDYAALEKLAHNTRQTKLRKALLMEAAQRENLSQFKEFNELFVAMDKNNTGRIRVDDMKNDLQRKKWKAQDIQTLLDCLMDSNGEIPYEEFMVNLMVNEENVLESLIDRMFKDVDRNSKGSLDAEDIERLLMRPTIEKELGQRDAAQLLKAMDSNRDGRVSIEEFKAVIYGIQPETIDENGSRTLDSLHMTRRASYQDYRLGLPVEYYSKTHGQWIPAKITDVNHQKGLTVEVMGVPKRIEVQDIAEKVRPGRRNVH